MMTREYSAHSVEGGPIGEWHGLHDLLLNVASFARQFAEVFNAGDWAYVVGLWHDLGKYSEGIVS